MSRDRNLSPSEERVAHWAIGAVTLGCLAFIVWACYSGLELPGQPVSVSSGCPPGSSSLIVEDYLSKTPRHVCAVDPRRP